MHSAQAAVGRGATSGSPGQRQGPCTIPAFVGPLVRSRHTKPCPIHFEVSFLDSKAKNKESRRLHSIVFRNFYCSHVTIKQRRLESGGGMHGEPWVTILRDRALMEDPHHEDDAQFWHVITTDEFDREAYDAESAAPLRIYLHQPSPMWKVIALQHVKCVSWPGGVVSGVEGGGVAHGGRDEDSGRGRAGGGGGGFLHSMGDLGDLCRGISDQVQIFGDKQRGKRMS